MVESTDGGSYIESFKPELDDPDCCGGLSSSIIAEISILARVFFSFFVEVYAKNVEKIVILLLTIIECFLKLELLILLVYGCN